ncbi:MAG TPA: Hpt domain-containing protein, partial [Polyangia bacterium]|nr:Hpt domain-containing protein [Polyangia bacterium]
WAVAVHATFVVLESVAACFVARSFFDNVIGLEKIVQRRTNQLSARNRDMRMVFDNVAQGFATVNLDGTLLVERSATAVEWLGPHQEGKTLWEHVAAVDAQTATWMQLGWEALIEDVLPMEMAIDQLPKRCTSGARTFALEYRPVVTHGKLSQVLLVMSDITAELEREKIETEQRDFLAVFQRLLKDKKGFLEFFAEADDMVSAITRRAEPFADLRRYLHTLKGNCGLFGLSALAAFCHQLETNAVEAQGVLAAADRERLGQLWGAFAANLRALLGANQSDRVEIDHREYAEVLAALEGDGRREEIATRLKSWQFETAELRLGRLAEQARAIAGRLGKGPLNVVVEPNDLRLYPESWAAFWSAFTHAIRNAVDHGLESSDERLAARKPATAEIRLASKLVGPDLIIEIRDDGRGVAWDLVRERAIAAGLPHATRDDLVEALFADGVTTRREVSEFSGRGIGMGALRAVCRKMGGTVEIQSEAGRGVCLRFKWTNVHARMEALVLAPLSPLHVAQHTLAAGEQLQ